jgi:hypothetical protein
MKNRTDEEVLGFSGKARNSGAIFGFTLKSATYKLFDLGKLKTEISTLEK